MPPPGSFKDAVASLYTELHRMAARMFSAERTGHTLQPTALVNELYLRLASGEESRSDQHANDHERRRPPSGD